MPFRIELWVNNVLKDEEWPAGNCLFSKDDEIKSNIEISAPYVSREHAELTLQKNRWVIENFSSVTATTLNGEIIYSPTSLKNGDIIEIGDFAFRYEENR